jgi:uncharacterized membrane protein
MPLIAVHDFEVMQDGRLTLIMPRTPAAYVTGLIEVGSALALLTPRVAVFGALALVPTMVGAILAQLFIVHTSPVPPTVLLVGATLVLWARRHELPIPKQSAHERSR